MKPYTVIFFVNDTYNARQKLIQRAKCSFYYLNKIPNSFLNSNCGYMYVVRLFCSIENLYFYKFGFSENIEQRFERLNYEFDCHNQNSKGNNFVVLYVIKNCTKRRDENYIKNILKPHKQYLKIKGVSKQECVKISHESYDVIKNTIETNYSKENVYKNNYELVKINDNYAEIY